MQATTNTDEVKDAFGIGGGETSMKNNVMEEIAAMRHENYSYQFIADHLGMPMNTVKSLCRRRGITAEGTRKSKIDKQNARFCEFCGKWIPSDSPERNRFCSNACRSAWRRRNMRVIEINPQENPGEREAAKAPEINQMHAGFRNDVGDHVAAKAPEINPNNIGKKAGLLAEEER